MIKRGEKVRLNQRKIIAKKLINGKWKDVEVQQCDVHTEPDHTHFDYRDVAIYKKKYYNQNERFKEKQDELAKKVAQFKSLKTKYKI